MSKQKQITKDYFDKVVQERCTIAYDPEGKCLYFPTGQARENIVITEMKKLNSGGRYDLFSNCCRYRKVIHRI